MPTNSKLVCPSAVLYRTFLLFPSSASYRDYVPRKTTPRAAAESSTILSVFADAEAARYFFRHDQWVESSFGPSLIAVSTFA